MAIPSNPILISALSNTAITVEDADTLLIDQGAVHKKITGANFKASLLDTWQIFGGGPNIFYDAGNVTIGSAVNFPRLFTVEGASGIQVYIDESGTSGVIGTNTLNSLFIAVNGSAKIDVQETIVDFVVPVTSTGIMTATNFQLSSDERDKNILERLGGDKVKFIRFNTNEDKRDRYGVSAQELQKTMPDLVEKSRGGKLVVKYIDLLISEVARLSNKLELINASS